MVRPGALERRSARRRVCPRAEPPPPGPVSVFRGFCLILVSRSGVPDSPEGSWGMCGWGLRFFSRRRSRRPPLREAPAAFARAKSQRGRGGWERGAVAGPPRARGGEGRGRRSPETWRELLAGGARERCTRPLGGRAAPPASAPRFAAHLLLLRGAGDELPVGQGKERQPPPGPRRTFSLSSAVRPARGGWAGSAGRAEAPGRFRRRRKDGGAPAPLRSPSAWSGASPTPWPWLR